VRGEGKRKRGKGRRRKEERGKRKEILRVARELVIGD
jgi:hypothetical protein